MSTATSLQLAQKHDLVADFLHRNVVVLDAGERVLHFIQLVVVCGKHHLGPAHGMVVQKLSDGPSDTNTIVSARTTSDFIQQHEAPRRHIIQNACRLVHLNHKSRFA